MGMNRNFTRFEQTPEFEWVKVNAHRHGFIIRYPRDKEHITGYAFEPWHLRFVGLEIAAYIFENEITFDEYYELYLRVR